MNSKTYESMKKGIDSHSVISFDVFDTLLIRPYVTPTDLFFHIEQNEGVKGFAVARIKAEKNARKLCQEITIDEIYSTIDEKYAHMKMTELDYESSLLKQRPDMITIYRYAVEHGKKVIMMSDMYLSSCFICEVLKKNGFESFEEVFVSCEHRCNKRSGELFNRVISRMGVDSDEVFHIGDNKSSDFNVPMKNGIDACFCSSVTDDYFSCHKTEYRMYHKKRSFEISVIIALDAIGWIKKRSKDYWYDIGYRFGGPMVTFFSIFVKDTFNSDKIFFVARDGYNVMKVMEKFFDVKDAEYVYAARIINTVCGPCRNDDPEYVKNVVNRFLYDPEVKALGISNSMDTRSVMKIFNDNLQLFNGLIEIERNRYDRYIKNKISDCKKIFIVDTTTMKYSSQRLLEQFSGGIPVVGCYYNVLRHNNNKAYVYYNNCTNNIENWSSVNLSELFTSSSESPVIGISDDGMPIYKNNDKDSMAGCIHDSLLVGEMDYVDDITKLFAEKIPKISSRTIDTWLKVLIKRKSKEDLDELFSVRWYPDELHEDSCGLIFSPKDAPYYVISKLHGLLRRMKYGP